MGQLLLRNIIIKAQHCIPSAVCGTLRWLVVCRMKLSEADVLQLLAEDFQISARVLAQGEEVVPRFRIFTSEGEFLILVQMLDDPADRERRMGLVAGFMAWKMATAFVVSGETITPDAVFSVYVTREIAFGQMRLVDRRSKTLGRGNVLLDHDCDPTYRLMLPSEQTI